jgi:hypothetical protein
MKFVYFKLFIISLIIFITGNSSTFGSDPSLGLNVLSFGATGDGKADDTMALQNAFDAACIPGMADILKQRGIFKGKIPKRPSRRIFLPTGTYRITKSLKLDHRHMNLAIIGIGGSWVTYSGEGKLGENTTRTRIMYDGAKGKPLFDVFNTLALRMKDITLDGNNKAGIILDVNANGYGVSHFSLKRINMIKADIGIELGRNRNLNCADMTFDELVIIEMKKYAFKAASFQQVNYVFSRPLIAKTPIGFYFNGGGSVTFTRPTFGKVDTLFKIRKTGISTGIFDIQGLWFELMAYSDHKKRATFVDVAGECNMVLTGFSTAAGNLWGKDGDYKTPAFIVKDGAQISVIGSMICGRIAELTSQANKTPSFIQFDNCRFRCASNPYKDISRDKYSGYEFRNCNVVLDNTKSKPYKIFKKFMIPRLVKYPVQAKGQPGYKKPSQSQNELIENNAH